MFLLFLFGVSAPRTPRFFGHLVEVRFFIIFIRGALPPASPVFFRLLVKVKFVFIIFIRATPSPAPPVFFYSEGSASLTSKSSSNYT